MTESIEWLTVTEVAARLRMSTATVRDMCVRGELPAVKVGGRHRINAAQLDAQLATSRRSSPLVTGLPSGQVIA